MRKLWYFNVQSLQIRAVHDKRDTLTSASDECIQCSITRINETRARLLDLMGETRIRDVTIARNDDPPVTRNGVSGRSRRWWMTLAYDIDEWTTCRPTTTTTTTNVADRRDNRIKTGCATCAMLIRATKSRGIVRAEMINAHHKLSHHLI